MTDAYLFVGLLATVAISSLSGIFAASFVRWSPEATAAGIPLSVGVGLAPLLLGLLSVSALAALPGHSHDTHLFVVLGPLTVLAAFGTKRLRSMAPQRAEDPGFWSVVMSGLLAVTAIALILTAMVLPLESNDPLEYAIVARELFERRDLAVYPMIASASTSGFHGPWTHPPLYPALIYTMFAIQGHADSPGPMALIAAWATLAAAWIVVAIGQQGRQPRTFGVLAGAVFLSTPLVFTSGISAPIDPLPVLAFSLLLAMILGVRGGPLRDGIACGGTLGLALWTHSQAILFPFFYCAAIGLRHGWRPPGALALQILVTAAVACVIAIWPYLRNLTIFGVLISDAPLIFTLEELDWPQYFRTMRELDTWPNRLQYGVLKGWFEVEMFSITFWLMLLGLGKSLAWLLKHENRAQVAEGRLPAHEAIMVCASGVVLCYLCGATISAMFGQDVMIRNARYVLMLTPCVALLIAGGIVQYAFDASARSGRSRWSPVPRRIVAASLKGGAAAMIALHLAALINYTWKPRGLTLSDLDKPDVEKLARWRPYGALQYLKNHTPADAVVFSLKPADMFYADRRMVSYLDPATVGFYRKVDPVEAWDYLRALGIGYVYVPDYSIPPLYNSALAKILARPDLSILRHSSGGYQVYELFRGKHGFCGKANAVGPSALPWTQEQQYTIVGWRPFVRWLRYRKPLLPDERSEAAAPLPIFTREMAIVLKSPIIDLPAQSECPANCIAESPREYSVEMHFEGFGLVRARIEELDADGKGIAASFMVGEAILGEHKSSGAIVRRLRAGDGAVRFRLLLEHRGLSFVQITQASVQLVQSCS